MWPLVTLYVHGVLGQDLAAAGFVLMLQSLAGMAGQMAGGLLYDRVGGKAPLVGAVAGSALICALLALTRAWWPYVGLMTAFGLTSGMATAPTNALVAAVWPAGGRDAFNVLYVANNVGVALGATLGGLLAERSFPLTFAGAAAGYGVYAAVVGLALRLPEPRPSVTVAGPTLALGSRRRMVALLGAGVALGNAAYAQWQSAVAVYMTATGFSPAAYGALWTLNGIMVVAFQPAAAAIARRLRRLPRQLVLSAALYGLGFLALLFGRWYPALVGGMAALTAGEVFERPASPALMAAIAPPGQAGAYQGMVGTFISGGRMVGPVLGGLVYDAAGPTALWLAAVAACGVAAGCYRSLAAAAQARASA
jgi:MFS family permease